MRFAFRFAILLLLAPVISACAETFSYGVAAPLTVSQEEREGMKTGEPIYGSHCGFKQCRFYLWADDSLEYFFTYTYEGYYVHDKNGALIARKTRPNDRDHMEERVVVFGKVIRIPKQTSTQMGFENFGADWDPSAKPIQ